MELSFLIMQIAIGRTFPGFIILSSSFYKLSTHHSDSLSPKIDTFSIDSNLYNASTCRSLVANKFMLAEPITPERSETTVCRTSNRVLVDAYPRRKESRDKIKLWRIGATRHHYAPNWESCQQGKIWLDISHRLLRLDLNEVIKDVLADIFHCSNA